MPATYISISTTTLSTSAASVTISSIPNTYKDLVLRWSSRSLSGNVNAFIRFNGSSSAVYSYVNFYSSGGGSAATTAAGATNTYLIGGNVQWDYTTGVYGNVEMYIPNYTGSLNKTFLVNAVTENNTTTSYITQEAGLWKDASAISSITITGGTDFDAGSSFYLYGIKNS